MNNFFSVALLLFIILLIAGCTETTAPGEYSDQLVVSGFLFAGRSIDSVMVQHTLKIDDEWTEAKAAIRNAIVVVSGNGIDDTLLHDASMPGRYYSIHQSNIIKHLQTYALKIIAPGYPVVTGSTIIPGPTWIVNRDNFPDSLHYNQGMVILKWEESFSYADYIISLRSLDVNAEKIIEDSTSNSNQNNFRQNRTIYFTGLRGMNLSGIPWFLFRYYGKYSITFSAIDENYYDYVIQMNTASTDVNDIRYRLQGGLGVFGSAYADTLYVNIVK